MSDTQGRASYVNAVANASAGAVATGSAREMRYVGVAGSVAWAVVSWTVTAPAPAGHQYGIARLPEVAGKCVELGRVAVEQRVLLGFDFAPVGMALLGLDGLFGGLITRFAPWACRRFKRRWHRVGVSRSSPAGQPPGHRHRPRRMTCRSPRERLRLLTSAYTRPAACGHRGARSTRRSAAPSTASNPSRSMSCITA
jgi:hypothetical protein